MQAKGLATFTAAFAPGTALPPHRHECGEAITILDGKCTLELGPQAVELGPLDSVFVPAGSIHAVRNLSDHHLLVHTAFASAEPNRDEDLEEAEIRAPQPFHVCRIGDAAGYDLADGTEFHDLYRGGLGASGICGGWARFEPGASLPCHFHEYDESITIISGDAVCLVEGRRYELSGCDTALVPQGLRHRFVNLSDKPMEMIWVYAGDEPSRTVVDASLCSDPERA